MTEQTGIQLTIDEILQELDWEHYKQALALVASSMEGDRQWCLENLEDEARSWIKNESTLLKEYYDWDDFNFVSNNRDGEIHGIGLKKFKEITFEQIIQGMEKYLSGYFSDEQLSQISDLTFPECILDNLLFLKGLMERSDLWEFFSYINIEIEPDGHSFKADNPFEGNDFGDYDFQSLLDNVVAVPQQPNYDLLIKDFDEIDQSWMQVALDYIQPVFNHFNFSYCRHSNKTFFLANGDGRNSDFKEMAYIYVDMNLKFWGLPKSAIVPGYSPFEPLAFHLIDESDAKLLRQVIANWLKSVKESLEELVNQFFERLETDISLLQGFIKDVLSEFDSVDSYILSRNLSFLYDDEEDKIVEILD